MKKVCIVRNGYYPSDPRVRKEAEALADKEYEVDVICLKGTGQKSWENINGINIYRLPLSHRRRKRILGYVLEYSISFILFTVIVSFLFFKKRYCAIQVNTLPDFLVFTTLIPKLFGAKIIIDMHEIMPELLRSKFGLSKKHLLNKIVESVEGLSTKYADYAFAACKGFLQLHICRGLSLSKTIVIHNVPDEDLFDFHKYVDMRSENREFTLISHGSVLERYGFQVLIKAIPYLKKDIPKIRVIVLGDGEYLQSLRKIIEENNLKNHVNLKGRIPLDEVPFAISAVDVGVVPIIKDEFTDLMSPNKLFEYVAMKRPVIAVKTKGIEEYFDDSCVMFFESGNEKELAKCILELYKNPNRAEELVENAWSRYEKIRWNVTKQVYLKAFFRIIKEH